MFKIIIRNVVRRSRSFALVLAAVSFGMMVMVIMVGSTAGLGRTLKERSARYFGGTIGVQMYGVQYQGPIEDPDRVLRLIRSAGLPAEGYSRRSVYYGSDAQLISRDNGSAARQRRLIGVDWALETANFDKMDFVAGNAAEMKRDGGILISEITARSLGIGLGEACVVVLNTDAKQRNTAILDVRGIFRESNFYGYSSYLGLADMNRLMNRPAGTVTDIGVILPVWLPQETGFSLVRKALAPEVRLFPPFRTKAELDSAVQMGGFTGMAHAVLTLDARLDQLAQILNAMDVVTWLLLLVFSLVIVVGVANSFRMIVFERTKELGTMRAIGSQRGWLTRMIIGEALFIGVVGCFIGGLGGLAGLQVLGQLDFSGNGLVEMFLTRGRVSWYVEPVITGVVVLIVLLSGVLGALGPARTAAAVEPVVAIRNE